MSDILEQLQKLDDESDELRKENIRLHASIKDALDKNYEQRKNVESKREAIVVEQLENDGLNILMNDPVMSKIIYSAHWNNGSGSSSVGRAFDAIFSKIPYSAHFASGHIVDDADYSKAITKLVVAVPLGAESDKLDELSEVYSQIFEVQEKIMEDSDVNVSIGVFEDSLSEDGSYSIKRNDDGEFYLSILRYYSESSVNDTSYVNLRDVFDEVLKDFTYGATDDYKKQNPDWDRYGRDDNYCGAYDNYDDDEY